MAKYIYVGRDLRDQFISLFNHYKNGNEGWYGILNDTPGKYSNAFSSYSDRYSVIILAGLVGDPLPRFADMKYTESSFFNDWISKGWPAMGDETDGYPFWSAFDQYKSWWEYRHLPNIMFIHYNDMLEDLPGSIRKIAAFIGTEIKEEYFNDMVHSMKFETMKANAESHPITNFIGGLFEGGAKTFINKGTNGRWKEHLSEAQLAKFHEVVQAKLTPDAAAWLEHGSASKVDPKTV